MITEQEIECMNLTRDLYNKCLDLEAEHIADMGDITYHIHAIQNIILSRVGIREYRGKENFRHRETK